MFLGMDAHCGKPLFLPRAGSRRPKACAKRRHGRAHAQPWLSSRGASCGGGLLGPIPPSLELRPPTAHRW
eukprot:3802009-Pyramimonas_sp.AAC.1